MNNLKIAYDGRLTAWNTKLVTPRSPKAPAPASSPEWELFSSLPPEGKEKFLTSGLGSSHVVNSHNPEKTPSKARRGTKGITSYGRSIIRCGAQWLTDRYGARNLSFLTCTLPESALAVCTPETWAEVVRQFLQSLRRQLVRAGLCPEIVGCIEIQEKRLQKTGGIPPLHLHLIFQGRQPYREWSLQKQTFRELWEQTCQNVWSDCQGFGQSTRVESIRSSAVSYLGKYMSKGGKVLSQCNPDLLPSAWYTISTKLKKLVKDATFKVSGQSAHDLYEYFYSSDKLLWARSVWSDYTEQGTCYLTAWIGQIRSRDDYWSVVDTCREVMYATAVF